MKRIIKTDKAPGAIGPYSQAVEVNGFIYTAGQIPVNPETGEIPAGIEAQTKQALANVQGILRSEGLTMSDVIKATVFLKDMNSFSAMNGVYSTFFTGSYPARSAVEVARLPKDVLIEIEVIAAR